MRRDLRDLLVLFAFTATIPAVGYLLARLVDLYRSGVCR